MQVIKTVAIYFSDLCKERQEELLKLFRVNSAEDMNWNIFPLTLIEEPEHEEGETIQPK